ncbi:hypothetical protein BDW67DRAFT_161242, partial [Aspergillus spinulosporus]
MKPTLKRTPTQGVHITVCTEYSSTLCTLLRHGRAGMAPTRVPTARQPALTSLLFRSVYIPPSPEPCERLRSVSHYLSGTTESFGNLPKSGFQAHPEVSLRSVPDRPNQTADVALRSHISKLMNPQHIHKRINIGHLVTVVVIVTPWGINARPWGLFVNLDRLQIIPLTPPPQAA